MNKFTAGHYIKFHKRSYSGSSTIHVTHTKFCTVFTHFDFFPQYTSCISCRHLLHIWAQWHHQLSPSCCFRSIDGR